MLASDQKGSNPRMMLQLPAACATLAFVGGFQGIPKQTVKRPCLLIDWLVVRKCLEPEPKATGKIIPETLPPTPSIQPRGSL